MTELERTRVKLENLKLAISLANELIQIGNLLTMDSTKRNWSWSKRGLVWIVSPVLRHSHEWLDKLYRLKLESLMVISMLASTGLEAKFETYYMSDIAHLNLETK